MAGERAHLEALHEQLQGARIGDGGSEALLVIGDRAEAPAGGSFDGRVAILEALTEGGQHVALDRDGRHVRTAFHGRMEHKQGRLQERRRGPRSDGLYRRSERFILRDLLLQFRREVGQAAHGKEGILTHGSRLVIDERPHVREKIVAGLERLQDLFRPGSFVGPTRRRRIVSSTRVLWEGQFCHLLSEFHSGSLERLERRQDSVRASGECGAAQLL